MIMLIAISLITVAAVLAVYAIALWLDAPAPDAGDRG
jgi:hypothetical protein